MVVPKAFGWEVTVEFSPQSGKAPRMFHYRGCGAAAARRKGLLKRHAFQVTSVEPVTEEQWIRAYGIGRM